MEKMTKKKYWFVKRRQSFPFYPNTWHAWFILGIYLALLVAFFIFIDMDSYSISDTIYAFVPKVFMLTGILFVTCLVFGEEPKFKKS
ncbi:MAG: hypothetical protein COX79_02855 [Candidatus Levybacteria bacterium CG_4_10_14_0_2_um_filter_36_16]|nr:MAG: hypothetical protein AUK12_01075 [Candidatus Levybacteria bacterium CG2_30_37_29]PIR78953.1 MAG: hypothetical protein COU26_03715 [Candidatus Levybacteria bacterium CG10_big_fil_rev_8_21_14_0_10_36_30]PIZ97264.1 MAG: hypothetical protein COX79_02855 [Candidatus Levybacteria bacterium CG_4_10_14_0_2_um_filter_36_16]